MQPCCTCVTRLTVPPTSSGHSTCFCFLLAALNTVATASTANIPNAAMSYYTLSIMQEGDLPSQRNRKQNRLYEDSAEHGLEVAADGSIITAGSEKLSRDAEKALRNEQRARNAATKAAERARRDAQRALEEGEEWPYGDRWGFSTELNKPLITAASSAAAAAASAASGGSKRAKLDKTGSFRVGLTGANSGGIGGVSGKAVKGGYKEWGAQQRDRLVRAMLMYGYGRWTRIRKEAGAIGRGMFLTTMYSRAVLLIVSR
jgi:hypothetical protein